MIVPGVIDLDQFELFQLFPDCIGSLGFPEHLIRLQRHCNKQFLFPLKLSDYSLTEINFNI